MNQEWNEETPKALGLKTTIRVVGGTVIETVRNSRFNVVKILTLHSRYKSLGLNEFDRLIYFNDKPIDDNTLSREATWLEAAFDIRPTTQLMLECFNMVGEDRKFHPIKEFFKGKKWDTKKRLEYLLENCFGAAPSPLNRAYSKKFFIGAVRRALFNDINNPIKHDSVLVLYGRQGLRKSTAIEALSIKQKWFGDMPLDIGNKDYVLHLNGRLFYELKELAKRSKDRQLEKAFIDQKIDSLRRPYGKIREDVLRFTSLWASTNVLHFLNDDENRRWWPVICGYHWQEYTDSHGNVDYENTKPWDATKTIDVEYIRKNIEQIWLEAIHYATKDKNHVLPTKEIHWLTYEEEVLRKKSQKTFMASHPKTPLVMGIVETLHEQGEHYFKTDDVIKYMDMPISQKDHKLRIVVEHILKSNHYDKAKRRLSCGSRKWLWGYNGKT
jgi:predicted P-loop ATPase